MSPGLLALLRLAERVMIKNHRNVRATYGDDGARYPRDFYRPADSVSRRWLPEQLA